MVASRASLGYGLSRFHACLSLKTVLCDVMTPYVELLVKLIPVDHGAAGGPAGVKVELLRRRFFLGIPCLQKRSKHTAPHTKTAQCTANSTAQHTAQNRIISMENIMGGLYIALKKSVAVGSYKSKRLHRTVIPHASYRPVLDEGGGGGLFRILPFF